MKFKSHPVFLAYSGYWKNGSFNGWGTLHLKQDEIYVGEWTDGERNGVGMFQYSKVSPYRYYRGQWANDEFNGIGALNL